MPLPFSAAGRTLLVVDDQPGDLAHLVSLFSAEGYRVLAATDGEAALGLAARRPTPDIVVVDADMPGMDGFELLQRLRQDAVTAAMPAIVTIPAGDRAFEARATAAGANACAAKPFSATALLHHVRHHLAGAAG